MFLTHSLCYHHSNQILQTEKSLGHLILFPNTRNILIKTHVRLGCSGIIQIKSPQISPKIIYYLHILG